MTPIDLPYLWRRLIRKKSGRVLTHWNYRRKGKIVPIADASGKRLCPDDGAAFVARWREIHLSFEVTTPESAAGSMAALVETYRGAPEYRQLAAKTRRDYDTYLDEIKERFGRLPAATLPREAVIRWRDGHQDTPRRANLGVAVLRLLCSFAIDRPAEFRLKANPCVGIRKLKTGPGYRAWTDAEIAAFTAAASPEMRLALLVGLHTALRRGDALRLSWSAYDGQAIQTLTAKRNVWLWIPCNAELRAALDATKRRCPTILTTTAGRPWKADHFGHAFQAAVEAAGLAGVSFHGLRATFAARAAGDLTDAEIESILGNTMARHYRRNASQKTLAEGAIAKLERRKNKQ